MIRWFKSLFAWELVKDTGVWRYRENRITGRRKAVKVRGGYQPLDYEWLGKGGYWDEYS